MTNTTVTQSSAHDDDPRYVTTIVPCARAHREFTEPHTHTIRVPRVSVTPRTDGLRKMLEQD